MDFQTKLKPKPGYSNHYQTYLVRLTAISDGLIPEFFDSITTSLPVSIFQF